ncbi:MAG: hypothetical protein M1819_002993 [Sarea resinae]|nr:MAG: hypothetical protein M1819_002993 [Sarea resinae]
MRPASALLASPSFVFTSAALLRFVLLLYGLLQDAFSPVKYTDIDYYVFTDAARFVHHGLSPYARPTYRYTPLLAWLLLPTAWHPLLFSFGKVVFAASDLVAGWLLVIVLRRGYAGGFGKGNGSTLGGGMETGRALKFAGLWLLNPMVATISTRGSSEGLLGVMVMGVVWAVLGRRFRTAGVLLGLAVHFKIYPVIYAPAIVWWMDAERVGRVTAPGRGKETRKQVDQQKRSVVRMTKDFLSRERLELGILALGTFAVLNGIMFAIYGPPFIHETYTHHLTRLDHRHNFSPYNTLLYLSSSASTFSSSINTTTLPITPAPTPLEGFLDHIAQLDLSSLAFLPQLLLSAVLMPIVLAKRDLPPTMLAQTFAFVAFNKVCTSQALWLHQAYELEFLGRSTFVPGLYGAGVGFFVANLVILHLVVGDLAVL